MISTSNLTMRFGKKVLFFDISTKFISGSRYGLIGANGVGKSTFMKILAGLLDSSEGEVFYSKKLRLSYLRQDHYIYDENVVLDAVFMGNQQLWKIHVEREDLYSKEELTSKEEERCGDIEEEFSNLGGYEMDVDAAKLLKGLGISEEESTMQMKELSGAKKFRVLLAQALFGSPDILLLDEPTNHLDLATIDWLVNFLCSYNGVLVVISHDRYFLNSTCTHIADLDYQTMRQFTGNYDDFLIQNDILLEKYRKEKDRQEKRAQELRGFISRFGANAARAKQATARQKELEKLDLEDLKPSSRISPYITFSPEIKLGQKVFELKKASKSYDEELFNDFSTAIGNTDRIAICGDNAVGKTTLIKALLGKIELNSGSVDTGNTVKIGYFPQDSAEVLDDSKRALDWLALHTPDNGAITETELRAIMGRMLFRGEDSEKKISVLSGGERARLILASLILQKSNVLILDEPTNHLDLETIESLNLALSEFANTIIFVSHDKEFVNSLANRILYIKDKKIIDYPGNLREFMNSQN